MVVTTTQVALTELHTAGLAPNSGYKLGYIKSTGKLLQNDIFSVKNATQVLLCWLTLDSTGAAEPYTIASGNQVTMTGADNADAVSGIVLYRP